MLLREKSGCKRSDATWRMSSFEHPVCVFGVCDGLASPFDLQMTVRLLEEGRAGEEVDVEHWFGRHGGHGLSMIVEAED